MFGRKKIEVNAIADTQIEDLLRQTSQYDDLINGKIRCANCDTVITPENIGIIIPQKIESNIRLKFFCDKINCIEEYKSHG